MVFTTIRSLLASGRVCHDNDPGQAITDRTWALLADLMVAMAARTRTSRQTTWRRLQENDLKPWQRRMWSVPRVDGEFVARMEDVLE